MSKKKDDQSNDQEMDNPNKPPPTLVVWSIRVISLIFLLGVLGYLTNSALQPDKPAQFTFSVKTEACENRNGRWVLPVDITNEGSSSSYDLVYAVTLTMAEDQPSNEITLPLIGSNETISHEFWFDENPVGKGIECSVKSYLLP